MAGALIRELVRKLPEAVREEQSENFTLCRRVLAQKPHDTDKIYSLHEPHVYCVAKGKELCRLQLCLHQFLPVEEETEDHPTKLRHVPQCLPDVRVVVTLGFMEGAAAIRPEQSKEIQTRLASSDYFGAYCASPLPKLQFSFGTSTRLIKTSSGRTCGRRLDSAAHADFDACGCRSSASRSTMGAP